MAMREAKKKWEQEDRRLNRRNEVVMEAARNAYDKVEGVWLKKYDESKSYLEKVYADIKACFDAQHEVLERKALGLHKYHYSKQEKVKEMLIEASQALYAKTVRDIENENYALEKKFKSERLKMGI
jgi:homoserine acetyltransferase